MGFRTGGDLYRVSDQKDRLKDSYLRRSAQGFGSVEICVGFRIGGNRHRVSDLWRSVRVSGSGRLWVSYRRRSA